MRSAGQPEYDNAVRVLTSVQVAEYVDNISLARFDEIEVTSAAPAHAEALITAIHSCGGHARLVSQPTDAKTCLLTEGLANLSPTERSFAALETLRKCRTGTHACLLGLDASSRLDAIGGEAGLCRSFRIEKPEARTFAFSLEECANLEIFAYHVLAALLLPDGDYTLRNDAIWQDVFSQNLKPPAGTIELPYSPVWLISGGARGVTSDCAVELARRTGGTFLLLGRSDLAEWPDWLPAKADLKSLRGSLARNASRPGMPRKPAEIDRLARKLLAGAEILSTLNAIESSGAKARYIQADIGDQAGLQEILASIENDEGAITGIVHGAGILSDGRVDDLSLQDFQTVFAPKVEGFETLMSCLDASRLKHIAVFSSASAVFGNEGQANYAAANMWLNNVSELLAASLPDTQVKSFCWGPWHGGMVDDALARMFAERGIGLISRSEGARIFSDQLLLSPHEQVRFVIGDEWGTQ